MITDLWIFYITFFGYVMAAESVKINYECQEMNISLTQKIDGEGFHRQINWLLEQNANSMQYKLLLKLDVGPEMFINPDQIADLNRLGLLTGLIEGEVDIEAPAHLASKHTAYIFVPTFKDRISIQVPFHLRYQRAQIAGGFGKVIVNRPNILARYPESCSRNEITAPCDKNSKDQCRWSNVSFQALFDEVELLVPVGNLDDYPLVSIVTLLLGCAGCIYTLSVLSTTPL